MKQDLLIADKDCLDDVSYYIDYCRAYEYHLIIHIANNTDIIHLFTDSKMMFELVTKRLPIERIK